MSLSSPPAFGTDVESPDLLVQLFPLVGVGQTTSSGIDLPRQRVPAIATGQGDHNVGGFAYPLEKVLKGAYTHSRYQQPHLFDLMWVPAITE